MSSSFMNLKTTVSTRINSMKAFRRCKICFGIVPSRFYVIPCILTVCFICQKTSLGIFSHQKIFWAIF